MLILVISAKIYWSDMYGSTPSNTFTVCCRLNALINKSGLNTFIIAPHHLMLNYRFTAHRNYRYGFILIFNIYWE
jgi:hypothetical protein